MNAKEKNILSYELSKTNEDADIRDWHIRRTETLAILPEGGIIPVYKEHIETSFCFGESGYDAEEANEACHRAWNDEEFFVNSNMKRYRETIRNLENARDHKNNHQVLIGVMFSESKNCNLRYYCFMDNWQVIKAAGGSAYLDDLPGKTVFIGPQNIKHKVATKDDIQVLIWAYEDAATAHEKKLRAYLKRYGLSKVQAWTYWRDA